MSKLYDIGLVYAGANGEPVPVSEDTPLPVVGGGEAVPTSFPGGTLLVAAAATPEPLVAVATPCLAVWVGARIDANGDAVNTKPCLIGDEANQNIPIMPGNAEGVVIRIDDAAKVFVKAGVDGEGVAYRVFRNA